MALHLVVMGTHKTLCTSDTIGTKWKLFSTGRIDGLTKPHFVEE